MLGGAPGADRDESLAAGLGDLVAKGPPSLALSTEGQARQSRIQRTDGRRGSWLSGWVSEARRTARRRGLESRKSLPISAGHGALGGPRL